MAVSRPVIGVVVVGVGIAGRVRIRDVQEATCGVELKGFVSRRELDIPGVPQVTYKEALRSPDVTAVIICSDPDSHEVLIRQALDWGRHVLVEYPVALCSTDAKDLYSLADCRGLVLHEENIALLTESHRKLKELTASKKLETATSNLVGNYNGWVEQFPLMRKPFLSTISAIQAFYDVFGDMTSEKSFVELTNPGVRYYGEFKTKTDDKTLIIKGERHEEKVERKGSTVVKFEDGEVFDSTAIKSAAPLGPKKPGLFMQDLEIFVAKVRGEREMQDDVDRSIRALEIAEEGHCKLSFMAEGLTW